MSDVVERGMHLWRLSGALDGKESLIAFEGILPAATDGTGVGLTPGF